MINFIIKLHCLYNLSFAVPRAWRRWHRALPTHFLSFTINKYSTCINSVCLSYFLVNNFYWWSPLAQKSARLEILQYLSWKNTSGLCPGTPQVAHASKRTLQTLQKSLNITAVSSWHTSSWRSAAMTGPATGTGDLAATFKNSFNGAGNTEVAPSSQFWNLPDDFCGDRKGKTKLHHMYPTYPSFSVPVFPGALPAPGKKQKEAKLNLVKRNCIDVFHGKRRASLLLPSLPALPSPSGPHIFCPLLSPGSTSPWSSLLPDWLLLLLLSSASWFYPACLPLCSSMSAAPHPWDAKWEAVSTSTTQVVRHKKPGKLDMGMSHTKSS